MSRPYTVVKCGPPRSPEWYAARRQGIGSSEAAAVLGWPGFAEQHQLRVWLEKTGTPPPDTVNLAQKNSGRWFEEPIARAWADRTGQHIARPPALLRSTRWPCLQASVDFVTVEAPGKRKPIAPVEVKAVWNRWDEWQDGVPDYYIAQVIHQLIVLDADLGYVAALLNGEVKSYEVRADRELRDDIATALTDWWQRHIIGGERPPLEPIPDRALLDRAVPRPLRKQVEVGPLFIADLESRAVAAEDERFAKAKKERLTNSLCARMDDAEEAVYDGQIIATWKPDTNGRRTFRPAKRLPAVASADRTVA